MNKPIVHIENFDEVVDKACTLVESCQLELLATFFYMESNGVPPRYNKALDKKLDNGLKVVRYCFGERNNYKNLLKEFDKRINLRFVADESRYQRLLVADNKSMLFKLGNSFFFSQDEKIVESYLRYVRSLETKEEL